MKKIYISEKDIQDAILVVENGKSLQEYTIKNNLNYNSTRIEIIRRKKKILSSIKPHKTNIKLSVNNKLGQVLQQKYRGYLDNQLSYAQIGKLHNKSREYIRQLFATLGINYTELLFERRTINRNLRVKEFLNNKNKIVINRIQQNVPGILLNIEKISKDSEGVRINNKLWAIRKSKITGKGIVRSTYIRIELPKKQCDGVIVQSLTNEDLFIIPYKSMEKHINLTDNSCYIRHKERLWSTNKKALTLNDYKNKYELLL